MAAALLDVNLLVALFDSAHVHHDVAHRWFAEYRSGGWATCPLTENGLLRILSSPSYPGNRAALEDVIERLAILRANAHHAFWPDALSFTDTTVFRTQHIQGHRQLTDIYLLALALRHGGRRATLDRSIPLKTVRGADSESLMVIT